MIFGPLFPEWQVDTPIHEAIGQAIGAASMCWNPPPSTQVFDSELASAIVDELLALLQRKQWAE